MRISRVLAWPRKPEQDEIMPRKNGVHDLRHDRVFVAHNAGKQRFAALDFADQIIAEFVFDGTISQLGFGIGTVTKRSQGAG